MLVFPGAGYAVLPFFWIPKDTVDLLEEKGDPTYAMWVRQGYLKATEGNVTDYDVIRTDIGALAERFDIQELAYDRWGATQLITQLQGDGITSKDDGLVGFGQGYASMSAPSKEFEKLILSHALRHGNHPVMTWCVGNVAVEQDAAGNTTARVLLAPKPVTIVLLALS